MKKIKMLVAHAESLISLRNHHGTGVRLLLRPDVKPMDTSYNLQELAISDSLYVHS